MDDGPWGMVLGHELGFADARAPADALRAEIPVTIAHWAEPRWPYFGPAPLALQ